MVCGDEVTKLIQVTMEIICFKFLSVSFLGKSLGGEGEEGAKGKSIIDGFH